MKNCSSVLKFKCDFIKILATEIKVQIKRLTGGFFCPLFQAKILALPVKNTEAYSKLDMVHIVDIYDY